MSKKFIKKIAAIAAAMTMAVSSMAICANAQEYQISTGTTSGGTKGQVYVTCYVFKRHYSKTQGAPERTNYGIYGYLAKHPSCDILEKNLITNWTASGKVYTSTSSSNVTGTSSGKTKSYSAYQVATGLNQSTAYSTYSLSMKCSSTELGGYTYNRNGAF